jgi:hypothetical protein
MDALTPEERAELNAWIAEHIYQWTHVRFGTVVNLTMLGSTERWYGTPPNATEQAVPNYAGDWFYAGPLFDRYTWTLEHSLGFGKDAPIVYHVWAPGMILLATGTTGPEAIAKAVKAYEERA